MQPAEFDLSLYRGDTSRLQLKLWSDQAASQPIDLTGATAASQIRNKPGGDIIVDMACTVTTPNIIDAVLLAADSDTLPKRRGAWDLEVTAADVFTPIAGKVTITEDITAPSNGTGVPDVSAVTTTDLDLWFDGTAWSITTAPAPGTRTMPDEGVSRAIVIEEAPKDGKPYVRQDGRWLPLSVALHGEEI